MYVLMLAVAPVVEACLRSAEKGGGALQPLSISVN